MLMNDAKETQKLISYKSSILVAATVFTAAGDMLALKFFARHAGQFCYCRSDSSGLCWTHLVGEYAAR